MAKKIPKSKSRIQFVQPPKIEPSRLPSEEDQADTLRMDKAKQMKNLGEQVGKRAGQAFGTEVGGPIGGVIGGAVGNVAGKQVGKNINKTLEKTDIPNQFAQAAALNSDKNTKNGQSATSNLMDAGKEVVKKEIKKKALLWLLPLLPEIFLGLIIATMVSFTLFTLVMAYDCAQKRGWVIQGVLVVINGWSGLVEDALTGKCQVSGKIQDDPTTSKSNQSSAGESTGQSEVPKSGQQ